jgi:hypothetical protein
LPENKNKKQMRIATIAKAHTRPEGSLVGRLLIYVRSASLQYCATRVFTLLAILGVMLSSVFSYTRVHAAANETVNFQARILTASGAVVPDGDYNVEFKIYDSPSAGASAQGSCSLNSSSDDCWWVETRTGGNAVRVVNGYVTANLGSVTAFGPNIPWDQDLYITMRVGGVGAPVWDSEMVNPTSGRMKLSAVPYAFKAKEAQTLKTTNGANSTTVSFAAPTSVNTITFGDGSGLVCLDSGNCANTAGGYLLFGPNAVQNGTSSGALIRANQQGSGGLLDLQSAGLSKFAVAGDGLTTIASGVQIGNTTAAVAGTIRWTGSDYEGYDGAAWRSLTAGSAVAPFAAKTKTANEVQNNTVNPTAALQPDDQLFFSIGANETWNYRFYLQISGNATPDIKFSVTAPAGATCVNSLNEAENALAVGNLGCGVSTGAVPMTTATDVFEVAGTITNGATAGNVTLNWAQNTASAANVTVLAGSFLEAQRSLGGDAASVAYVQGGNSFGTTAVLGTNDVQPFSLVSSGVERVRLNTDATATLSADLLANAAATGTTGTTSGTGTSTTTLTLSSDTFNIDDVVMINNVGQDYFTRITSDPGTGTYTVSPSITFEAGRTVTKYTVQSIGASSTNYLNLNDRFFQGYFLGGIVVGAGSTHISDGEISRTSGDITLSPGSGARVQVNGELTATSISGDGSGITNINSSAISGATLTNLDAANISSGTLNDVRLSTNIVRLDTVQSFSAAQTFGAGLVVTDGQSLTIGSETLQNLVGTGLANNAGNLNVVYGTTSGTAVEGSTTLVCPTGTGNLSGGGNSITLGSGGTCDALSTLQDVSFSTSVTTPLVTSSGPLTIDAASGASLTLGGAHASNITLGNSSSQTTLSGSTIVLGAATLRRSAAGTTNFEFNDSADTTVAISNTDIAAKAHLVIEGDLTAANLSGAGSGITAINATNLSSGTVNDSRLSSNVTKLNTAQNFSAGQTFDAGLTVASGQALTINSESFSDLTGTGLVRAGSSLAIDSTYFNANYIQLGAATAQTDSSTNSTINVNKTGASGNLLTLAKNASNVFVVGNSGALQINSTSTTALDVRNAGGTSTFTVDTSGNLVRIGPVGGDATGVVLVLGARTTAGDPTGSNGAQYYNSANNKFRCFENGAWADCISTRKAIRKPANTARTSNTTLTSDPDLQFSVAANTTYAISCTIFYDTQATPDFKYATTGPTATLARAAHSYLAPGSTTYTNAMSTATAGIASTAITAGTGSGVVTFDITLQNGATAGTWAFQWAQNTSNAAATTVLGGSSCEYSAR